MSTVQSNIFKLRIWNGSKTYVVYNFRTHTLHSLSPSIYNNTIELWPPLSLSVLTTKPTPTLQFNSFFFSLSNFSFSLSPLINWPISLIDLKVSTLCLSLSYYDAKWPLATFIIIWNYYYVWLWMNIRSIAISQ